MVRPRSGPDAGEPHDAAVAAIAPPNLVAHCDASCRYLFVNRAYAARLGRAEADIIGKHLSEVLGSATFALLEPHIDQALSGRAAEFEERVDFPGRGKARMFARYIPDLDVTGTVCGFTAVISDTSAHEHSEFARLESEARFRLMADAAPVLIWVSDAQKKGIFFNKGWLSFTGRSLEQEIGDGWLEVIHPEDVERAAAACLSAFEAREPFRMEFRMRRADGRYRWMLDHGVPRFTETGELAGYIGSCVDFTDRHGAEQELLESQQQFRLALDAGQMGSWEWSMETNRVVWSPGLEAIHGLEAGTFPGTYEAYWSDVHPEDRARVEESIRHTLESGEDHHIEYRIKWPDDSIHFVEARGRLFRNENGKPVRMIGVCADVTARKEVEQRLREEDRRKDEFLALLSHELRNPLAAICTGVEATNFVTDEVQLARIREMMARQTRQLVAIVDDLLEVSRITRGKLELRKTRVSLTEILASAVETARPGIDEKRHTLSVAAPSENLEIEADPHRLSQILSNLLHNAAKYTPEGGTIELTLARSGDQAQFTVRDSGIGIPDSMQDKIFDMFTQVVDPLDRGRGAAGLGVGLTLAKTLAEMHGGTIEVRSEGAGQGSEFRVCLPIPAMPKGAAPAEAEAGPAAGVARQRVLVVDDNVDAAEMLRLLVEGFGSLVRTAADGAAAVAIAAEFRPNIVLMDLGMPRMNGYDAAVRIRNESWGKDVFLVALTGWGKEEDRQRVMQAGFDRHIVKPANPDDLRALLARPCGTT